MCRQPPISSVSRAGEIITSTARRRKFSTETIVSQNLLGLKSDSRLDELFTVMDQRKHFAICVQETWRHGKQILEHENSLSTMPFHRLPRKMISSWVASNRPVGCPEFTYGRGLDKALRKVGIYKKSWHEIAQDRAQWRNMIKNC